MPPLPFQSLPFPLHPALCPSSLFLSPCTQLSALEADQLGLHQEVRNREFWQETGRSQANGLPH